MSNANPLIVFQRSLLPAVLAWSFVAAAGEIQVMTINDPAADKTKDPAITSPTPAKSNREVERDILIAMMHDDIHNSMIYKNVKIVATNGHVTLTGRVKNEKQKTKLLVIATGVVGAANLQEQIEVK
jgi:osmotically-inducible protein OsmY